MDYAGLDHINIRYPVNRPLTDDERNCRYLQGKSIKEDPMEFLSTIRLNSNYIELVDRWYSIKGFSAWLGFLGGGLVLGLFIQCIQAYFFPKDLLQ